MKTLAVNLPEGLSQEVLEKAKEKLVDLNNSWVDGVCRGKSLFLDGKEVTGLGHGACHSWLHNDFGRACYGGNHYNFDYTGCKFTETSKPFLLLNCHSKKKSAHICSPESHEFLIMWMAKESLFSEFILNRDDDKSLREGGIILLCGPGGATLPQAMWICKVLRLCTEGARGAETFMELVKNGVNPLLSLLVASHVRTVQGATFGYTGLSTHSSVFNEGINGFGDRRVYGLLTSTLDPNPKQTGSLFECPKEIKNKGIKGVVARIGSFCKPVQKSDGWGGTTTGKGANGPDFVKNVLVWQKELEKDIPKELLKPVPTKKIKREEYSLPFPDSNTVFLELDL